MKNSSDFRATEIRRRRQQSRKESLAAKVSAIKEKKDTLEKWEQRKRLFLQPLAAGGVAVAIMGGVWLFKMWWWGGGHNF